MCMPVIGPRNHSAGWGCDWGTCLRTYNHNLKQKISQTNEMKIKWQNISPYSLLSQANLNRPNLSRHEKRTINSYRKVIQQARRGPNKIKTGV